jgi:hypothetical protein
MGNPPLEVSSIKNTFKPVDDMTLMEKHQGGQSVDSILAGNVWIPFSIHFGELNVLCKLAYILLQQMMKF